MLHKDEADTLPTDRIRAYPTHQIVQTTGSTAMAENGRFYRKAVISNKLICHKVEQIMRTCYGDFRGFKLKERLKKLEFFLELDSIHI
jgi:hypothetical protein